MSFSDRLTTAGSVVIGLGGLTLLARLDVPVILHGGLTSALAALELFGAAVFLSAAFSLGRKKA